MFSFVVFQVSRSRFEKRFEADNEWHVMQRNIATLTIGQIALVHEIGDCNADAGHCCVLL